MLWCAVKAVQEEFSDLECVVYTGDHDASPESLAARAIDRFGVQLIRPPKVHSVSIYVVKTIRLFAYITCVVLGYFLD